MVKVLISEAGGNKLELGNPDSLVRNGGSWSSAIGRLFQGDKDNQRITIQHQDGLIETLYLEELHL